MYSAEEKQKLVTEKADQEGNTRREEERREEGETPEERF
jgi:hypothetical protein